MIRTQAVLSRHTTCPYCREPVGAEPLSCAGCSTAYHPECAAELVECGTLGCPERLLSRGQPGTFRPRARLRLPSLEEIPLALGVFALGFLPCLVFLQADAPFFGLRQPRHVGGWMTLALLALVFLTGRCWRPSVRWTLPLLVAGLGVAFNGLGLRTLGVVTVVLFAPLLAAHCMPRERS